MIEVIWDLEDDPDGNLYHITEHGVAPEEVEEVLNDPGEQHGSQPFEWSAHHLWVHGCRPSAGRGVGGC
jgi:hypothetical protein